MNSPRWQRRAEDRPREICAAALQVFAEKGFAAAKLDEIAKRAGVSKGTLYLYFQDKADLFRAVIRDTVVPNVENMRTDLIQTGIPFAQLIRFFFAQFAPSSVSVMPSLRDPSSANETYRRDPEHQEIPPGTMSSTPQCR